MSDLRAAAQQALEACTDAVSGWQSLAPLVVRRAAEESLDALRAALADPVQEPDLFRCPKCGGPADNGHDRSIPPNPYWCTRCMGECPNCASLEAQNTELDRKLAELTDSEGGEL